MTLEQEIKDHEAPIEPACELDPDCANCPFPERKAKWDTIWDKFIDWAVYKLWRIFLGYAYCWDIFFLYYYGIYLPFYFVHKNF